MFSPGPVPGNYMGSYMDFVTKSFPGSTEVSKSPHEDSKDNLDNSYLTLIFLVFELIRVA